MTLIRSAAVLAAAVALLPVAAQAQTDAAQANNAINVAAGQQAAVNAASQAGYDADMAAYRAALRAHHREVAWDEGTYGARQRAYAAAMTEWRHQVWLCDHGSMRACDKPTPDPAAFM